jgi:hypothetical protein
MVIAAQTLKLLLTNGERLMANSTSAVLCFVPAGGANIILNRPEFSEGSGV